MLQPLFFIAIVLLLLFIFALIMMGVCIGMAYLMIYFIPSIELVNALVPAAIMTTVFIFIFGNMFKTTWNSIPNYYEDEDEPEPPIITRIHPPRKYRNRR